MRPVIERITNFDGEYEIALRAAQLEAVIRVAPEGEGLRVVGIRGRIYGAVEAPRPAPSARRRTLREAAKGAVGLAKAELGVDKAPPELVEHRKAICLACPRFDFGVCTGSGCGCYLAAKVRIKTERCPEGKW